MMIEILASGVLVLLGLAIGLALTIAWGAIQELRIIKPKTRPARKLPKEIRRVSPYVLYDGYMVWVSETGSVWVWEHEAWKNTHINEVYFSDLLGRPQRVGKP